MNNEQLINRLINTSVLKTPAIISAFRAIDRADFILPHYQGEAYGDYPLGIGYKATISQPTTVALMLELLQPKMGNKVLDVGSGSGWTTALLAQLVGENGRVFGVEIISELVKFGKENVKKYQFENVHITEAGKHLGLEKKAPFDKILVSASAKKLPQELVEQLKVGGRMVLPIQSSVWKIDKVSDKKFDEQEFPGFAFVPLKA